MSLHRFMLRPRSPWRTPWLADTLYGRLALEAVRLHGRGWMLEHIQRPAQQGAPRWLLSDACPGDLLPAPASLKQADASMALRKPIKRCQWVKRETFLKWRDHGLKDHVKQPDLLIDAGLRTVERWHNSLTCPGLLPVEEGGLFARTETALDESAGITYLSLYAQTADDPALTLLEALLRHLADAGFGADANTGSGMFEVAAVEDASWLLPRAGAAPNCVLSLSTFQPSAADPAEGCWEAFVKHGKFASDAPVTGVKRPFKPPQIMLKLGAVLGPGCPAILGRCIRLDEHQELISETSDDEGIMQFAFGLPLPGRWLEV